MKKFAIGVLAIGAIVALGIRMQSTAAVTISGSAHDLSGGYTNGGTYTPSNKCAACHAAHKPLKNAQLWARANPVSTGWKVWNGSTGQSLGTAVAGYEDASAFVASGSGMCLSCHDGVTAIGNSVVMNAGNANLGKDLNNMHPVGKAYVDGTGYNLKSGLAGYLENGDYVGCTSCHSMHASAAGGSKLLRSGEVCTACHAK